MDRLTGWDNGHAYFTECFEEPCLGMGCVNEDCDFKFLTCQRLAKYEDIGLTPEQIREIDKFYAEKCREVAELKKKLSKQWIPVDERLPELKENQSYINVNATIEYQNGKRVVVPFTWERKGRNKKPTWCYLGRISDWNVVAWMPLPERYKPE